MGSFTYDLAGRLLTARNPESGTIAYAYDPNGNLTRRQDALGVVTCYGTFNVSTCDGNGYDAHNRPTRKTYSVPAGVSATPAVY